MRSAAIALAALTASLLVPSSTVLAQGLPQPGERVRVTSGVYGYSQLVATVKAISAELLVVRANGTDINLAMAQVSLLETRSEKGYADTGAVLGVVVGGVVGWAVANAAVDDCRETEILAFDCIGEDLKPLLGVLIGAGVGVLAGRLIGGAIKSDRWQAVPLDNLRMSFVPQRDGRFTLGMSVSF